MSRTTNANVDYTFTNIYCPHTFKNYNTTDWEKFWRPVHFATQNQEREWKEVAAATPKAWMIYVDKQNEGQSSIGSCYTVRLKE